MRPKKCQASVSATKGFDISHVMTLFFDQLYLFCQLVLGLNQLPVFLNTEVEKWNCNVSMMAFDIEETSTKMQGVMTLIILHRIYSKPCENTQKESRSEPY